MWLYPSGVRNIRNRELSISQSDYVKRRAFAATTSTGALTCVFRNP
jgi:hypothetical protein